MTLALVLAVLVIPCRWRRGGRTHGAVLKRTYGFCNHCGGRGGRYRWGVRVLGRDTEDR